MKKRSIAKTATAPLQITQCPTCGSKRIKQVRRNWRDTYNGQTYTVPNLSFWECPDCSERLFDRTAMRQIEACSPAYAKLRRAAG